MAHRSRKVEINGIVYESIVKAATEHGFCSRGLNKAINRGRTEYKGVEFTVIGAPRKVVVIESDLEERSFCPKVDHIIRNHGTLHVGGLMPVRVCR